MSRETLLAATFVDLADTLVEDFDVVDLLTNLAVRCVEVFDVDAAGLMLAAPTGTLRVVASSSPAMQVLEMFEIQAEEGPCPDSYRTGSPVVAADLAASTDRWPAFAPEAVSAGFNGAVALPLRLRGHTIGALNMFRHAQGELGGEDLAAAQAFADIATIGLINRRAADDAAIVNRQLSRSPGEPRVDRTGQGHGGRADGLDDGRCLRPAARLRPPQQPAAHRCRGRRRRWPARAARPGPAASRVT